jgi:membrane fusion protein, multidrug efflux system
MRRAILVLLCLLLAGGIGWYVLHGSGAPGKQARGRNGAGQPVPVLVAQAGRQDVPIYLDGLGTVQAFNSVTVRSMIDGPLIEVRFHEGQDVKAGDVLARIDPRPYQAALDQAMAKKTQDEASLANARLDLARYIKLAQTNYTMQ